MSCELEDYIPLLRLRTLQRSILVARGHSAYELCARRNEDTLS
jgi:hypothetical protein